MRFFINLRLFNKSVVNMSTFTQVLNPIIGKPQWDTQCDEYDYIQEIARTAFADMLHDTERNQKYYYGLKAAIEDFHSQGKLAHVLDIGTGTGLLSMMAVKCGADFVTACEAFKPMSDCAEKILENNNVRDKIKLIKKRSTDIIVGTGDKCDMESRANILVTEVFDTDLIGEGAIPTFQHATECLLTTDCIVVPQSANVYCQVVESSFISNWNRPKLLANLDGDILLRTPKSILDCPGSSVSHDLQMSQISHELFTPLTNPELVFKFDFSGKTKIETTRNLKHTLKSKYDGVAQAVLVWWDLKMDTKGEILLSCAPYWAHPDINELMKSNTSKKNPSQLIPWRDHWMQAIYYLPKEMKLIKNQHFNLFSNHNEYLLWFNVDSNQDTKNEEVKLVLDPPDCNESFYLINSRTRIGQLNDHVRNKKYLRLMEDSITKNSIVLSISDGSLIGLSSAQLGAKHVFLLQENHLQRDVITSYIETNQIKNVTILNTVEDLSDIESVTHIIAEPYFVTSILPWDNLYFGTLLRKVFSKLRKDVVIVPKLAKIYAVPVEFSDLHKIRAPLDVCEGFDMKVFDEMIDNAANLTDNYVDAQPLWEYPCKALCDPIELSTIDFSSFEPYDKNGTMNFTGNGICNGVAIWVDWWLDGSSSLKSIVTTGPTHPISKEEFIKWDYYTRQGVHLFPKEKPIDKSRQISWKNSFKPEKGEMNFSFEFE